MAHKMAARAPEQRCEVGEHGSQQAHGHCQRAECVEEEPSVRVVLGVFVHLSKPSQEFATARDSGRRYGTCKPTNAKPARTDELFAMLWKAYGTSVIAGAFHRRCGAHYYKIEAPH
jgi:hypothetical protein